MQAEVRSDGGLNRIEHVSRFDTIISQAQILDGTGAPAFRADVGIKAGRIAAIGSLPHIEADTAIAAHNLTLTPGFIDIHAHADIAMVASPDHEYKVRQGVTTEVFSNCGIGFAPVTDSAMADMRSAFGGLFTHDSGVTWDWRTVAQYLDTLDTARPAANVAYLVPHAALRASTMGMEGRVATTDEVARMAVMLRQALDEGAIGMSTGPGYAPVSFADHAEVTFLASVAGFCAVHQRDYRNDLLASTRETIAYARDSGARFQLSHLQTSGPSAEGKSGAAIGLLADAVSDGVDIACDMYPYTAGSTVLPAILPAWALDGGPKATLSRLADPASRSRIIDDLHALDRYWGSMVLVSVNGGQNRPYLGMPFPDIAAAKNTSVGELVCTLLEEEQMQVCYIVHHMQEEDLATILSWDRTLIGSDGLHLRSGGHPRVAGTFPRWLGRYARDRRLVTMPEAIRKVTSAPADRLGIKDRGRIAKGFKADLVLFDASRIADQAAYESPGLPPVGIEAVLVNGLPIVLSGKPTPARPGEVIRTVS